MHKAVSCARPRSTVEGGRAAAGGSRLRKPLRLQSWAGGAGQGLCQGRKGTTTIHHCVFVTEVGPCHAARCGILRSLFVVTGISAVGKGGYGDFQKLQQ
eukprot:4656607-Prymnesium_polylepis.1